MRTLVIDNHYERRYGDQLPLDVIKNSLPLVGTGDLANHWLVTKQEERFIPLFREIGGPPLGANLVGVSSLNYWYLGTLDVESIIYEISKGVVELDKDFWDVLSNPHSGDSPREMDQRHKAVAIVTRSSLFPERIVVINEDGTLHNHILGDMPMERIRTLVAYLTITLPERSMTIYLDL